MSAGKNFWSRDISNAVVDVPLTVIREAAAPLATMTNGLVEAEVKSGSDGSNFLVHRIYLAAPTIDFRMLLASFQYRVAAPYPVWAVYEVESGLPYRQGKSLDPFKGIRDVLPSPAMDDPPGDRLSNQGELEAWLQGTLGAEETTRLIQSLIATLRSPEDDAG